MAKTGKGSRMNSPEKTMTRKNLVKGAAMAGAAIAVSSVFGPVLRAFAKARGSGPTESGEWKPTT